MDSLLLHFPKIFLKALGIEQILHRLRLFGPLGEWVGLLISKSHRERHRLIGEDFRQTRQSWEALCEKKSVKNRRTAIICSHIKTVWAYKLDMMFAIVLQGLGYDVFVVYADYDSWRIRYHKLVDVKDFIDFRSYAARMSQPEAQSAELPVISAPALLDLSWRKVDVGRIVLSNIIYRHKFSKLDFNDDATKREVREELQRVKKNVVAVQALFDDLKPDLVVALEKGLSPIAEIFGACVAHNVPFLQYANAQHNNDFVLKKISYANRHQNPFSLDTSTWEKIKTMSWDKSKEQEILEEFENDYRTGAWFNRKYLHEGKKILEAQDTRRRLGLDPSKKNAVIFSHVLWDATFFFGKSLFDDYETWLVETMKAAYKNPRVNWVVKIHPDLVWKLKMENYNGELRDLLVIRSAVETLPPHITLVPPDTDIDTFSFFGITDYCLTVRGTIGIEMACRGIPVLTAGTGRYSGLGFTVDSESREEYLDRLSRIEELPSMSEKETELARRFAYTLFRKRPWPLTSLSMKKMQRDKAGHPLGTNVFPDPSLRSREQLLGNDDFKALSAWLASSDVDYLKPF